MAAFAKNAPLKSGKDAAGSERPGAGTCADARCRTECSSCATAHLPVLMLERRRYHCLPSNGLVAIFMST